MSEDTIVALATPPGRSALGIVRASGPLSRQLASRLLGPKPLEPRRATTRLLYRPDRFTSVSRVVDRVVATFWTAPATPTGEDLLEIAAHGSPEILREILEAVLEAGARPAEAGEFTRRAFINGRLDLAQARAVADLIAARGTAARAAALHRLEGGLARALDEARAPVLELLALIEARLDHPDADLPPLPDEEVAAALAAAAERLERLLCGYERGRIGRREGARVGLFGRPNAGKSSLLNALLGRNRAITAPEPGTTRDLLEEQTELGGALVTLVDTAGLREGAADCAEREGVSRAHGALDACEVAVLVVDATRAPDGDDARVQETVAAAAARRGARLIVALNKIDLLGGRATAEAGLPCSALTGEGLSALAAAIAAAAGTAPADEGEALLDDARSTAALAAALASVRAARAELTARPSGPSHGLGGPSHGPGAWEDRAASLLRSALKHLNTTRGIDASEEVLDEIFSRFCVGK